MGYVAPALLEAPCCWGFPWSYCPYVPLVAITSSAVRYHGLCRVFQSKVRSQILGAICPPEFDMAIKLMGLSEVSVSQLHRGKEQDRQIPAGAAG